LNINSINSTLDLKHYFGTVRDLSNISTVKLSNIISK